MAGAWIMWQGNKSTDFDLLLNEVPSMVSPGRRFSERPIAGADGALITGLGYEPFDLKVSLVGKVRGIDNDEPNERKYADFLAQPNSAEDIGKLILPFRRGYNGGFHVMVWFEARLLAQNDFTDTFRRKHVDLTFRCQPFARRCVLDGNDENPTYSPAYLQTGTTKQFLTIPASADFAPGRKPCVYVYCAQANASGAWLNISVGSNGLSKMIKAGKGYRGRAMTFMTGQIKRKLGLSDPVLVLDFEDDTYYACEAVSGHELLVPDDIAYYKRTFSAGSIMPYQTNSQWPAVDLFYDPELDIAHDGTGGSLAEVPMKIWHDVRLVTDKDDVYVRAYNNADVGTGYSVRVVEEPRARYLL